MNSYALKSGHKMYVPKRVEKTIPKILRRVSNDNQGYDSSVGK